MHAQLDQQLLRSKEDRQWLLMSSEAVCWYWPDCELDYCYWSELPRSLDDLGLAGFPSNLWGFAELIAPESRQIFESLIVSARSNQEIQRRPFEILLRLGKASVWMRVVGIERAGERKNGLRALLMNITESKLAESRARQESEHKLEFLGRMSHDMRTPLHAIIGLSEMLKDGLHDTEQRELIARVEESAETLLGLVNDLLDAEQIRTGKLKLELAPIHLKRVIRDCVALYEQTRRAHTVAVECLLDPYLPECVHSDRRRLMQVINNLLSNAFKFTVEGKITISVSVSAKKGPVHEVCFSVQDTGVGIAENDLPHLFKSFYRGTFFGANGTHSPKGQGLGLAISQDIVESFGGRLMVDSVQGVGSTFSFTIPMSECSDSRSLEDVAESKSIDCGGVESEEALDMRAAACQPHYWKEVTNANLQDMHLKVLVADDSAINRQIVGAYLRGESYEVVYACDGLEAVSLYLAERPSIILLDLRMPNMGGIDAAKAIRKHEEDLGQPRAPIIALSASTLKSDVCEALEAGFDAHIAKPVRRSELLDLIRKSIKF